MSDGVRRLPGSDDPSRGAAPRPGHGGRRCRLVRLGRPGRPPRASTTGRAGSSASTPRPSTTGSPRSGRRCYPEDTPVGRGAGGRGAGDLRRLRGGVPGGAAGRRGPLGRGPRPGRGRRRRRAAARMLGVARDTTDQRLARDTVARALEHMADGFLSVDARLDGHLRQPQRRGLRRPGGRGPRPVAVGRLAAPRDPRLRAAWSAARRAPASPRSSRSTSSRPTAGSRSGWCRTPDGTVVLRHRHHRACAAAQLEEERALSRPDQARAVLAYSAALAEADTLADVIDVVATMVLPAFGATGMLVSLVESNRLKLAGHSGYGDEAVAMLDVLEHRRRHADRPGAAHPRAAVPAVPGRLPRARSRAGGRCSRPPASRPGRSCPLTVSGRALGSLTISFDDAARLRAGRAVAAGRASAACSPRRWPGPGCATPSGPWPPSCSSSCCRGRCRRRPACVATARYLAATDGMGVGGDWYDVLELPGDRVALVIGDVQGHTMRAAAVMGQLRNALRAYAAEGHEPAAVMSRTNRLMADLDPGVFATCAIVDASTCARRAPSWCSPATRRRSGARRDGTASSARSPRSGRRSAWSPTRSTEPGVVRLGARRHPGAVHRRPGRGLGAHLRRRPRLGARDLARDADRRPRGAGRPAARGQRRPRPPRPTTSRCSSSATTACPSRPGPGRPAPRSTAATRGRPGRPASSSARTCPSPGSPTCARPRCCWCPRWSPTRCGTPTAGSTSSCGGSPTGCASRCPTRPPAGRSPAGGGLLDESGRGVPLMDALSDRWGTSPHGAGKVVWFELDLPT